MLEGITMLFEVATFTVGVIACWLEFEILRAISPTFRLRVHKLMYGNKKKTKKDKVKELEDTWQKYR